MGRVKKLMSLALVAALCATTACSSGGSGAGASSSGASGQASTAQAGSQKSEGGKKFGYTYWAGSDFFETIGTSMQEVAKQHGDQVLVVDAQQDQSKQLSIIEDFISQGVSAVFLNPVDRKGVKPALQKLKDAHIPVINVDTAVADLDMVDSFIASDNYHAGVICAQDMIKRFPSGGDIAILDYPANSAILDRVQGFKDTIKGKPFNVVAQQDAQGKPDPGLSKTNDILQAHPNLVAVFGGNDQCAMGAYSAITESKAKAVVYGVDGAPESKKEIAKGGQFVATGAQSPKKIGVDSIDTAYKILNNQSYEKKIAVPTFLIDKSNVSQYLNGWQ